jgi:hypothetical protein
MKKLFDILEALKPQFLEGLNNQLFIYTTIGSGTSESPMWIQMDQIWSNLELKFINSQNSSIAFYIPVDKEAQQLIRHYRDECYDYFKYVKYTYIKENAPTVWAELATGFNGARIHSFMDSYKPLYVKPTVQQLINDGMITSIDVLEYAQQFMDGVDAYDDEQLNKHTIKQEFKLNGDMANEFNDSFPSEEDCYWDGEE